jgi:hypothetical protein
MLADVGEASHAAGKAPPPSVGIDSGAAGLRITSPAHNSRFEVSDHLPPHAQRLEVVVVPAATRPGNVALWVDGQLFRTWTMPPYRALWPLSPGTHSLHATAEYGEGERIASTPIEIAVRDSRP